MLEYILTTTVWTACLHPYSTAEWHQSACLHWVSLSHGIVFCVPYPTCKVTINRQELHYKKTAEGWGWGQKMLKQEKCVSSLLRTISFDYRGYSIIFSHTPKRLHIWNCSHKVPHTYYMLHRCWKYGFQKLHFLAIFWSFKTNLYTNMKY